jgi:hypothetical protein
VKNRFIRASDPFTDEETITSSPLPTEGPYFQHNVIGPSPAAVAPATAPISPPIGSIINLSSMLLKSFTVSLPKMDLGQRFLLTIC